VLVKEEQSSSCTEWLNLNHLDYEDLNISYEIWHYPEDEPPVLCRLQNTCLSKDVENLAVHESAEDEEGGDGTAPLWSMLYRCTI